VRILAFDLETELIVPGRQCPRPVCASLYDGERSELVPYDRVLDVAEEILDNPEIVIFGANITFDFGVIIAEAYRTGRTGIVPKVFEAYDKNRVGDVLIAMMLHDIHGGHLGTAPDGRSYTLNGKAAMRYSLALVTKILTGREDAKVNDFWRKRYAILRKFPIESWPPLARQYPIDDVVNTYESAIELARRGKNFHDVPFQTRAALALHLGAVWSLRTDGEAIDALRPELLARYEASVEAYQAEGLFKVVGGKVKKDLAAIKRRVVRAYALGDPPPCTACDGSGKVESPTTGKPIQCKTCDATTYDLPQGVPRTKAGGVARDRDTLQESGDDSLSGVAMVSLAEKGLQTYLPALARAADRPMDLNPNPLLATGRTSYSGVIQLIPRSGGYRECFRAREGYYFLSIDYSAVELSTLAQVCLHLLGKSALADTINAGMDPHCLTAAKMIGEDYDTVLAGKKDRFAVYRQAAKPVNFGLSGGMGAVTFVMQNRKENAGSTTGPDGTVYPGLRFCIMVGGAEVCGVEKITEHKGRACPPVCKACIKVTEEVLKPAWLEAYPEMRDYFHYISTNVDLDGSLTQLYSNRVRGGLSFCSGANTLFQGLASEGKKLALWNLTKECLLVKDSPVYMTRPIADIHDEILSETPIDGAHQAAVRKGEIMVEAMRAYTPDVAVGVEAALMRRWYKGAEPAYNDKGELIPWEPS